MKSVVFAGAAKWVAADDEKHAHGLFRLKPGADDWEVLTEGLPADLEVRHMVIDPNDPERVFVGTQAGPYLSEDGGDSWTALALPGDNAVTWSIMLNPKDPKIVYAGTQDLGLFRSENGGKSWTRLAMIEPEGHCKMGFPSRVIRMTCDPARPDEIYVGIEVGGIVRSLDGGETWDDLCGDLLRLSRQDHLRSRIGSDTETEGMMDTHATTMSSAAPGTLFHATRMGLFRSDDRGEHWAEMGIDRFSDLTYARDVQVSPHDPNTLYAALSVAAVSDAGSLYRSTDLGETWSRFDHDVPVNSTMMHIGQSPRTPDTVVCAARRGQVFATEDGGETWTEHPLPEGVQGVYAVAVA